ncbi:MAG: heavy-metal-associated domain-containing protein [Lentisphaerae bacterium]|nr:heavy-metal-associated domain-containing protein [Lentisphaerota bacterium]
MKTWMGIGIAGLCLALLSACRSEDIRTFIVKVPGLKNAACEKLIRDSLTKQSGIASVEPDYEKRELKITYNSMSLSKMNIEFAIAAAGFDANETEADTNAVNQLPPECREPNVENHDP